MARRAALREAKRALEAAEKAIADLEARVAELTAILEDPTLYSTPEGSMRAKAIDAEREEARRELDRAYEAWTAAAEDVERLAS